MGISYQGFNIIKSCSENDNNQKPTTKSVRFYTLKILKIKLKIDLSRLCSQHWLKYLNISDLITHSGKSSEHLIECLCRLNKISTLPKLIENKFTILRY